MNCVGKRLLYKEDSDSDFEKPDPSSAGEEGGSLRWASGRGGVNHTRKADAIPLHSECPSYLWYMLVNTPASWHKV